MTKHLILTPRDQDILIDLYDLVFIDTEYLRKVHFINDEGKPISRQFVNGRMKKLEAHEFVISQRIPITDKTAPMGRAKNVYSLGQRGIEEVRELLGDPDVRWDSRWIDRTPSHIYHALEMAHVNAAFKTANHPVYDLHDWLNESRGQYRYAEGRDGQIKPDAVAIIHHQEKNYHAGFMIELERSRQRKDVSINKLKRYNKYCELLGFKKHAAIDVPIVQPRIVFVSARENEMINLMKHTSEVATDATAGVLYTTIERLLTNPYGQIYRGKNSTNERDLYGLFSAIK